MDVLILLDKLDDLIYNSRPIPLTDQVRVERTEVFGVLDEIRASMPEEIKAARAIVRDRQDPQAQAEPESLELRAIADTLEDIKRSQQRQAPPPLTAAAAEKVRSIIEAAESSAAEVREDAEREARKIVSEAERASRELRKRSAAEASLKLKGAEEGTKSLVAETARASTEIERLLDRLREPAGQLSEALGGGARALHGDFERMRARVAELEEPARPDGPDRPRETVSQPTEEWDSLAERLTGDYEADAGLPGPDERVEAERIAPMRAPAGESDAVPDRAER
jgi:hypothetical protein